MDDTEQIAEIRKRVLCRMWKMSSYGVFSCFMSKDGGETVGEGMVCIKEKFHTASPHAFSSREAMDELARLLHGLGFRAGMTADNAKRMLAAHRHVSTP